MQTDVLDKLIYADDMAENAKTETKMQGVMDLVSQACDNYNLTISTKDTEVVYINHHLESRTTNKKSQ